MKKLFTTLSALLITASLFSQAPQTMSYQAVIRNSNNALVPSTTIGIQISILQKSSTGDPVYVEKHTTTTNANGLATIEIGGGTPVSGRFETIDWSSGPYFLKTETDPTGGSGYSITGTSKLLSVPYALYAEKSGKSGNGDPWLTNGNLGTTAGTNFLGTTDPQPLMFKVNGEKAGYIDYDVNKANTGFGYQALNPITPGYNNTANGYLALSLNTTGSNNTAVGKAALTLNGTGSSNVAFGSQALKLNTTGSSNVAAGTSSMLYNNLGNYNTANGTMSLYNNERGSYNSAYGTSALRTNLTGNNNTAIGYAADVLLNNLENATAIGNGAIASASNQVRIGNASVSSLYFGTANNLATTPDSVANMYYNFTTGQIMRSTAKTSGGDSGNHWKITGNSGTIDGTNFIGTTDSIPFNIRVNNKKAGRIDPGSGTTFFGHLSGNSNIGYDNTAIGFKALTSNTIGSDNTAVGNLTLRDNTLGIDNTAVGNNALSRNTTGNNNTASGLQALFQNTTGNENTAIGVKALLSNTTGNNNLASGTQALQFNTTGSGNSAGGFNALVYNTTGNNNTANGSWSLFSNTAGSTNTAYGTSSLKNNITGNNNTAIGNKADVLTGILENATAVGNGAIASASNQVRIGNASVSSLYFGTANNLATTPDSAANMYYDFTTGQIMRSTVKAAAGGDSGNHWKITGNSGTIDGTNFIGTTDDIPFNIRVNNEKAGRIEREKANSFFGYLSGNSSNPSANNNTAIGTNALYNNTTGTNNTANGSKALYSTTISRGNTALGYGAGDNNVNNGSVNTFIGFNASANASGYSNSTALGSNASVTGNNKMILGDNTVNVGIGLSGITPGPGNKLEINSAITDASGLRFRMLKSTSTPIANPGKGVLSVDLSGDVIYVNESTGTGSSIHFIGEVYGGGIVFYVYDNGQHGLIAATADQSTGVVWTTPTFQSTVSNAVRNGVNGGIANTERIIIQAGAGSYAAQICANYQGGGYGDWYLPSKDELNLLMQKCLVVGGFITDNDYWSSTEGNNYSVWVQFSTATGAGAQNGNNKSTNDNPVRAIRAF